MQKSLEKCKYSNMGIRKRLQNMPCWRWFAPVFVGHLGKMLGWSSSKKPTIPSKNPWHSDTIHRGGRWYWSFLALSFSAYSSARQLSWWMELDLVRWFFSPAMTDPLLYGISTYYIISFELFKMILYILPWYITLFHHHRSGIFLFPSILSRSNIKKPCCQWCFWQIR